jgi:predicted RecA/RadA family phage recombinase
MAQTPAKMVQSPGDVLDYTPVAAVTAGDVIVVGNIPMIAPLDIAANALGALDCSNLYDVPKTSDMFSAGDAVYWDVDGTPVTGTALSGAADSSAATGELMGFAALAALTGDTYVRVKLTAAKRTATLGGSITADDITGSDSSMGITGAAPATTSSAGGAIAIAGSIGGSVTGAGGAATVAGGAGTAGNSAGGVSGVTGGAGQGSAAGGAVNATGGVGGATGAGGAATLAGGAGGATSGTGGAVTVAGGAGSGGNANGGAVTVKGGEPNGSGAQGTVLIEGARFAAGTTPVAITAATTLTLADSGGIFTVSQAAAYDIDLPSPTTGPGLRFFFSLTAAGANAVTITVAGSAATFVGSIQTDAACIVATGSTLTFASGTALLGDNIEIQSIATNLYHVRAVSSANVGITVA